MHVPSDVPDECPVCERGYRSVSRHGVKEAGLLVNLRENERFARVCVDAVPDGVDFYHHGHEQV